MAQIIALEWDKSELRVAHGRRYGDSLQVESLHSIPRPKDTPLDDSSQLAELLDELLGDTASGSSVLVNVPRDSVELRMMELPRVPADELPDMVRLQAVRHFNSLADNWIIDFIPSPSTSTEDTTQQVLAAAIGPDPVEVIQKACQSRQLSAARLALRSCSSAAAWLRSADTSSTTLLVDLLAEEAELTVVHQSQVALSRNVRLPRHHLESAEDDAATDSHSINDGAVNTQLLQAEIRRTIAAANSQIEGAAVETVVLFGNDSALAEQLGSELSLAATTYSCFDHVELREPTPEYSERFTALVGLIHEEVHQQHPAFDFLNPRQRPHVTTRREKTIRAGTWTMIGAAAVVLMLFTFYWMRNAQLQNLQDEANLLAGEIETAPKLKARRKQIQDFRLNGIVWLDELARLSETFPDSDSAIVKTMQLNNQARTGGRMSMDVHVRTAAQVSLLEDQLRGGFAAVRGDGVKPNDDDPYYKFRSHQTVEITPRFLRKPKKDPATGGSSEDTTTTEEGK